MEGTWIISNQIKWNFSNPVIIFLSLFFQDSRQDSLFYFRMLQEYDSAEYTEQKIMTQTA